MPMDQLALRATMRSCINATPPSHLHLSNHPREQHTLLPSHFQSLHLHTTIYRLPYN